MSTIEYAHPWGSFVPAQCQRIDAEHRLRQLDLWVPRSSVLNSRRRRSVAKKRPMFSTTNHSSRRLRPLLMGLGLLVAALGQAEAQAQTIVNIKGFGDGSGVTVPLSYPLAVGTVITMTNPVLVSLKAGDYLLADAWGQAGALYDAWNYELSAAGSWDSHFYAAVRQGTGPTFSLLLDALSLRNPQCIYHNCSWPTEAQAAAAFLQTPAFHLHLAADTVVAFSSTDYFLADNAGGMSISITAVPEPARAVSMLGGLALLVGQLRRLRLRRP